MRKKLAATWGFEFPEDLFDVWNVARKVDPKHPNDAFLDLIGVRLEGPFYLLAGAKVEADRGRWTSDPPELFTVASGDTDGLHWGYVVHEPGKSPPVAAHLHSRDSAEVSIDGTLYASLHGWLVDVRREVNEELAETVKVGEKDDELAARIEELTRAIRIFEKNAPRRRAVPKLPKGVAVARDSLAIVCAPKQYEKPNALPWKKLFEELRDPKKRPKHVARIRELLSKGKPGGALHLARDLYLALPEADQPIAAELLREVYLALDRPVLARALEHIAPPATKRGEKKETPKPKSTKPRSCDTLAEALEGGLDTVEDLAITYHSANQTAPSGAQFRAMKRLKHLTLRGCKVPDLAIANLPLEYLELFNCTMKSFPSAITKLASLDELKIVRLKKPLPKGINLPKLERLEIVDCALTAFPELVCRSKKITSLSLNKGRITKVPDELANLRGLSYLSLSDNRIAELPDVFDRLPKLSSVWLDNNRLTRLPDSIGALKGSLKTLSLGKNPLTKDAKERARIKKLFPKAKIYWT